MKKHLDVRWHCKADQLINFADQKTGFVLKSSQLFDYIPTQLTYDLKKEFLISLNEKGKKNIKFEENIQKRSFAEIYADYLLNSLLKEEYQHHEDILCEKFYKIVIPRFIKIYNIKIKDKELLCIYAKQLIMMLKKSHFFSIKDGIVKINSSYFKIKNSGSFLFDIFWNQISWKAIFPSMPEFAQELWENRMLLIELLLQHDDYYSIDRFTQDYLLINGKSFHYKILLASFLDFSICSWLSNFGFLDYNTDNNEKIFIKLNTAGRSYFSHL